MSKQFEFRTFVRRGSSHFFGARGRALYCGLGPSQPVVLHRDPGNPKDSNAVRCTDLNNAPFGYIAREHASLLSNMMLAGLVLMARTDGACSCKERAIYVWSEGEESNGEEETAVHRQVGDRSGTGTNPATRRKPAKVEG